MSVWEISQASRKRMTKWAFWTQDKNVVTSNNEDFVKSTLQKTIAEEAQLFLLKYIYLRPHVIIS